jgi:hypothetical protein
MRSEKKENSRTMLWKQKGEDASEAIMNRAEEKG